MGNFLKDAFDEYNKNIKKNANKIFIAMSVIFVITLIMFLGEQSLIKVTYLDNIIKKAVAIFAIILSSFVSHLYIPAVGIIIFPLFLVQNIYTTSNILFIIYRVIISIMQLYFYSIVIAYGINICKQVTNNYKALNKRVFGYLDLKKQICEIRKDKKGIEKIEKKLEDRAKKNLKLKTKINYKNIFSINIVLILILTILTIVSGV